MGKQEKIIKRLFSKPNDFTKQELKALLTGLGYQESTKGKTSGSRICYYKVKENGRKAVLALHSPHPGNVLKPYMIKIVLEHLIEEGEIDEL